MTEDRCDFGDGKVVAYHIHTKEMAPRKRYSWMVCKENFKDHCETIYDD